MANTQIGGLSIPISASTVGLATGLAKSSSMLGGFARGISSIGSSIGSAIPGAAMLLNPVTAVVAAIGGAAAVGINFEKTMSHVGAVLDDANVDGNMTRLKEFAHHLGSTTQFSAISAAQGMVEFAQAGLKTQQIIDALPATLNLAAAGGIELKEATAIAAKTMAQFGLQATDMPRIADVLALAAAQSNTNVHNLGEAFKFSGTMAKVAGKSIEETAAVTMALAQGGLDAEMAGTALRGMMMKAANQTEPAKKAMEELNLSFEDSDGNFKHMSVIFDEMKQKLSGLGRAKQIQLIGDIFEQRAATGFLTAMEQGGDKIRDWEAQLKGASANGGAAAQQAATKTKNAADGFQRVLNALTGAGIRLYDAAIEPWLTPLLNGLPAIVRFASPIVSFFLKWGLMLSPIGLIVAAIKGVAHVFGLVLDAAQPLFEWLQPVLEAAKGVWTALVNAFTTGWHMIRDLGLEVWDFFTGKLVAGFAALKTALGLDGFGTTITSWRDTFIDALITVEFGFDRFKDVGELAFLEIRLGLETFKENVRYILTDIIPSYLNWLGENWKNIFQDMANIAQIVMKTVMENLARFGQLLPKLLLQDAEAMGEVSGMLAKGIVLNFDAKTKPLPEIAGRQMTDTEKELAKKRDALANVLGIDLTEHLEKRRKQIFGPKQGTFWTDLIKGFKGAQDGPPGGPGSAVDKLASAMEANSKDAVSLVSRFRNRLGVDPKKEDKMLAVAEKQLHVQTEQSKKLDRAIEALKDRNAGGKFAVVSF